MRSVRVLGPLVVFFLAICVVAQETTVKPLSDSDIAMLRQDVQSEKTKVITDTMQFTDAEAKGFWPIYREYSHDQQVIGDQRVSLMKDYAEHYDSMTDAKAEEFMNRLMKIDDSNSQLRRDYFPKFKKVLGAKRAAKFFQVDNRLSLLINLQLAAAVPLIK